MSDTPAANAHEAPGPELTAAERAELDARLAEMVQPPTTGRNQDGELTLSWYRRGDNGEREWAFWTPTAAERRAATLFYEAANRTGPFARRVPPEEPVRRSTEEEALVRAIVQNRADDTGYLVYADYLTENGDPQGDYIRLCVEWQRQNPGLPWSEDTSARADELLTAHAEQWYAPLGALGLRPTRSDGTFYRGGWHSHERGVIERVEIDTPDVLPRSADRLFAAAPFLRELKFNRGQLDATGLAEVERLAQIEKIDLWGAAITAADLRALLGSRHLTGLKELGLNNNALGAAGAEVLSGWPGLARLESLGLWGCEFSAEAVRALAACPRLANLRALDIGYNHGCEAGLPFLLGSPHVPALTELRLSHCAIDPPLAACFRTAAFRDTLRKLGLTDATFATGALEEFARCALPELRELDLNFLRLDDADEISALARAPFRSTLEVLDLTACMSDLNLTALLRRSSFPKLSALRLNLTPLGRAGAAALAGAAENLPALTTLDLWDTQLGAAEVELLARSAVLANVTDLDLGRNDIGVPGAAALARSEHLTNLKGLKMDESTVGDEGERILLDRFGAKVVHFG
jgi:uncharacterized protein (TIGR02996 family)